MRRVTNEIVLTGATSATFMAAFLLFSILLG